MFSYCLAALRLDIKHAADALNYIQIKLKYCFGIGSGTAAVLYQKAPK